MQRISAFRPLMNVRTISNSAKTPKRLLQTISQSATTRSNFDYVPLNKTEATDKQQEWTKHSLPKRESLRKQVNSNTSANTSAPLNSIKDTEKPKKLKKRRALKPRKALITLTPNAIKHLRDLMNQPEPKYIKVGVKNRGCSGLSYHLEYVSKPEKFDEIVKVDNDLMIIIDSKALFSIIGSEMDYVDDKLSSRFVFNNPNSKGSCGCGESFMV